MKRIVLWLLIVAMVLIGVSFSVLNAEVVTFDYYFAQGELPLSIVVVVSLLFGALLGALSTFLSIFKLRREVFRLRKQVRLKEQEIGNLCVTPMKEK